MANYSIDYELERPRGSMGVVLFRLVGSCLSVLALETRDTDDDWSGEIGSVSAKGCLVAAERLKFWIRHPKRNSRSERTPTTIDIPVDNYGIAFRSKADNSINGEPHPDIKSVTLLVGNVRDASSLADCFRDMHHYMTFVR